MTTASTAGRGRVQGTFTLRRLLACVAVVAMLGLWGSAAWCGPQGGTVVGGDAQITQPNPLTTIINQASGRAIINWNGFSIDVNELVQFIQPGQSAVALNRVTGLDPSVILGQLNANGRVFILNPNGIVFGSSAQVDVAGLIASTLNMNNADFMAGKGTLQAVPGAAPAAVINRGQIRVADNGFVFLVAPSVRNEGLIIANLGQVALGAGNRMSVDFAGDGMIKYAISGELAQQLTTPDGQTLNAAASNGGTISAHGGSVVLSGDAALQVVSSVVSNEGTIDARSTAGAAGQVALEGRGEGIVLNTGTVNVSGLEAGAAGGSVTLSGDLVGQAGLVRADSGTGGAAGDIAITSTGTTLLAPGSLTSASGRGAGATGGDILLASDNSTIVRPGAVLEARGGEGGVGGLIKIGLGNDDVSFNTSLVDTSAPGGVAGTLFIDPAVLTIANGAGADDLDPTAPIDFADDAPPNTIYEQTLEGIAGTNNIILQAQNQILIQDLADNTLNLQTGPGNWLVMRTRNNAGLGDTVGPGIAMTDSNDGIVTAGGNILLEAGYTPGGVLTDPGTLSPGATASIEYIGSLISNGGDIIVRAPGGFGLRSANANTGDVQLEAPNGSIGWYFADGRTYVMADNLGVIAGDSSFLATSVNTLTAHIGGTGALSLEEVNDITLADVDTVNGAVVLNAGGSIAATDVATTAGVISLTASGDIQAGSINAAGGTNNVALTAGGAITDGAGKITANTLTAQASGAMTLDTSANSIAATSTGAGNVAVTETDAVTLTNVEANNGSISVTAGGTIAAQNVTVPTENEANDISLTSTGGGIQAGSIRSGSGAAGDVTLSANAAITDANAAAVNVTADDLNATAGGGIDLDTTVNSVSAHATGAGDISLHETTSVALTDVDTANGAVNVTAVGTIAATDVASTTDNDANDISLTSSGGNVVVGSVTAGSGAAADVTLAANGTVVDNNGGAMNVVADSLSATAGSGVELDTTVNTVTAHSTGLGGISLREANGVTLADVDTADGAITVTAGGNLVASDVASLTDNDANDINLTSAGGSIQAGTVTAGAGAAADVNLNANLFITDGPGKITGDALTANASAGMTLDTSVNSLDASVTAAGPLTVTETDGITLADLDTFAGSIDVTAGGQITATDVASLTDNDADDISLTSTGGGIQAGTIAAGAGVAGDVTLNAAGAITDGAGKITADVLTADADGAMTLDTTVNSLDASTHAFGALILNETDAVTLTDVDTQDGLMNLTAGGTITAVDVASLTDREINDIWLNAVGVGSDLVVGTVTGGNIGDVQLSADGAVIDNNGAATNVKSDILFIDAGGDVSLDTDVNTLTVYAAGHNVAIDELSAVAVGVISASETALTAGGAVSDGNGAANNVTGTNLTVTAGGGIDLDTSVANLTARTTAAGNISVREADAIALTDVDTANGSITVTAGGQITATDVASLTDSDANDIALTSTGAGIEAGIINAGTLNDVILDAQGGAITDGAGKITAHVLTADAAGAMALDTTVSSIIASTQAAGDLTITETDGVTLTDVDTADGSITVTAGGQITATDVASLTDSDANDISLTSTGAGIGAGIINAGTLGDVILDAQGGAITHGSGKITADLLTADAAGAMTLDTTVNSINASTHNLGNLVVTETDDVTLTDLDAAAGVTYVAAGGQITAVDVASLTDTEGSDIILISTGAGIQAGLINAGSNAGDVSLSAQGGAITDGPGKITAHELIAESAGAMALDTTVQSLTAAAHAPGDIVVTETDALVLGNVATANGAITVTAGGLITAVNVDSSATDSDANDISLTSTGGGIHVQTIDAGTLGDVILDAQGGPVTQGFGDLTADALTVDALGGIRLATRVNSADFTTHAAGDIWVDQTGDLTLSAQAANGWIDISTTGNLIASNVVSSTDTDTNDISLDAGGGITVGTINSGTVGDVRLLAEGPITDGNGAATNVWADELNARSATGSIDLDTDVNVLSIDTDPADININEAGSVAVNFLDSDGGNVTLTAGGAVTDANGSDLNVYANGLDITAGGGIELDTLVKGLEAETTAHGDIVIREVDGITLNDVATYDGSITIAAGGPIDAVNVASLHNDDGNDILLRSTAGDIHAGTINAGNAGDVTLDAQGGRISDGPGKILADVLTADAAGSMVLDTTVNFLDASTHAAGGMIVSETNAITLGNLDTANGSIEVTAGGRINAVDVASLTSSAANGITLTSTGAGIRTGSINAGALGAVTLDAQGGAITYGSAIITADALTALARGPITLATDVNSVRAHASAAGSILVSEVDDIVARDLSTTDGAVTLTAGGQATVERVIARGGDAADVLIDSALDIRYGLIDAGAHGDVTLVARGGGIARLPGGKIIADVLNTSAAGGMTLNTQVSVLLGTANTPGNVYVTETDGLTLMLLTDDGAINVTAGGQINALVADSSHTDSALNDIRLTSTGGGIRAGIIDAGTLGDVTLNAAGGPITSAGSMITGHVLTADALGPMTLNTAVDSINASTHAAGNIFITEADAVTLTDVDTVDGSIWVAAGGAMNANNVASLNGLDANDITLISGGAGIATGSISAGPRGDIMLQAQGGAITRNWGQITGDTLSATAFGPITLNTAVNRLEAMAIEAGNITVTEADGITLANVQSHDGAIRVTAGGQINADLINSLADSAANDISLTSTGGGIRVGTIDAHTLGDVRLDALGGPITSAYASQVRGHNLVANAAGGMTLFTAVDSIDASTTAAGNMALSEQDNVVLHLDTFDGRISVAAGGQVTAAQVISHNGTDANDIGIDAGAGIQAGDINAGTRGDVLLFARGGSITDGAGKIVGDDVTGLAAGAVTLDTTANSIGVISAAGNIRITETDAVTLADIEAGNGSVTVTAGGQIHADRVLTSATNSAANDISLTSTGGGIRAGAIETGPLADVTLRALGGEITTAGTVAGGVLRVEAAGPITLSTRVDAIDATTTAAGDINLFELDSVTLTRVATADGSIDVTAGGQLTAANVRSLTSSDANDITLTSRGAGIQAGTIDAGARGDITLNAQNGAITDAAGKITGDVLIADARGPMTLDTDVNRLDASTSAAGNIVVTETDGLVLADLDTADGSIRVTAGGELIALDVQSLTDSNTNDLSLSGNGLRACTINAGTLGDVTLDAGTGALTDGSGKIVADQVVASAGTAMTLDTTAAGITAAAGGNLTITETDGVTLTDVESAHGAIDVTAGGQVTALNVAARGGSDANDISIDAGAGIQAGNITAVGAGDVTLNARGGAISHSAGTIMADNLTVDAAGAMTLVTAVNSLQASTRAAGDVLITETDDVSLTAVEARDGSVAVTSAGGDITVGAINAGTHDVTLNAAGAVADGNGAAVNAAAAALDVTAGSGIALDTTVATLNARTTGGNIRVTETDGLAVGEVATAGNVLLQAGGALTDANGDAVNVTADDLNVEAAGGIDLDTTVTSLTARATAAGDININETDELIVNSATTTDGSITITAAGTPVVTGAVRAPGQGGIEVGTITAGSGDVSLSAAGGITGLADSLITADSLSITAGGNVTLNTNVGSFAAATGGGDLTLNETDGLQVGTINAAGGSAAGNVTLNVLNGAITAAGGDGITGNNITLNSGLYIGIPTQPLVLHNTGSVNVILAPQPGTELLQLVQAALVVSPNTAVTVDPSASGLVLVSRGAEFSIAANPQILDPGFAIGNSEATTGVFRGDPRYVLTNLGNTWITPRWFRIPTSLDLIGPLPEE